MDLTRVDPVKRPQDWTAADVSFWPDDCAKTDACGRWFDKASGDLFVVLWHDIKRDLLHGYRQWRRPSEGLPDVQMWHVNGTSTLAQLYTPVEPTTGIESNLEDHRG